MKLVDNLKEIRKSSTDDLKNRCKELKEELFNLKFQLSLGQLANTTKVREVRRNIARINTILTERELISKEG
ncbi:MAG: 50S ribosomal protein L29 [Fusobacteria bacterium]|jgi:large subunit ribosomal protein L29|nr:50S ribosomal protein L29 [Fusobacteriota bacterium]